MSYPVGPTPGQRRTPRHARTARNTWWRSVLLGLASAAAGVVLFAILAHMEADGGTVRMNWLLVLLYKWLGKWGVLLVLEVVAVVLVATGVRQRTREKAAARGVTIV